jgi:dipeptidyl aminopeptidase/acylaminoacyl peptidase
VRWDASASFALVQAERSTWALDVANKAQIKVLSDACGFGDVHFDPARRQLIAVKHSPPPGSTWCTEGEQAITFFDLNTGAETRRVEFPNVERPIRFVASSDGRTLAVRDVPNGFAVYESFLVLVSGETGAITEINDGPSAVGVVRFSPDGRYMALAYVFYVRVWDVWNLPSAVEDRRPLYFLKLYDGEGWWDYRFASNTVIEIGVRGGLTRRFDLSTGQYVN